MLVIVTAIAARQGNAAIAANQVAFRIWNLLTLALDAIAIAGQAITGRYLGARRRGRGPRGDQPDDRLGRGLRASCSGWPCWPPGRSCPACST